MKKLIIVGILVMVMAMATPAMAFEKGTIRLGSVNGLIFTSLSSNGGDYDRTLLGLSGGYFVTPRVEVGLNYLNMEEDVGGFDESFNEWHFFGKYYFPMDDNYLYAGGGLSMYDLDGTDGDGLFAAGGYVLMVKDWFSADFGLRLETGDIDGTDYDGTFFDILFSIYF